MRNRTIILFAGAFMALTMATSQAKTRILPLGDSVTSSFSPNSSYRYWLWHDLVDAGFNVEFVGTQQGVADGPPDNPDFDPDHEGHPGWTTQDALENIDAIIAATQPDIVLLDLGANDVQEGISMNTIEGNLEGIIEHLRAANPNIIVLLADPTPYHGPNGSRMSKLKGVISQVVRLENQPGSPVIIVNLFAGFNVRKDTSDGMHPNEAGEQLIAQRFFAALQKVL